MKRVKLIQKMKKVIVFLVVIAMLIPMFFTPVTSHAHNAFFLQVLIDDSSMTFMGNVVKDDASFFNDESKHIENQLGDTTNLLDAKDHGIDIAGLQKTDDWKSGSGANWMAMTFPGKEVEKSKGFMSSKVKNDRTGDDADRAYLIKDLLVPGLNDILVMKNNGKKYDSINELVDSAHNVLNAGDGATITLMGKDYTMHWGKRNPNSKADIPSGTGLTSKDYLWLQSKDGKTDYEFVWRVPKGYLEVGNVADKDAFKLARGVFDYKGDAQYITWGMMAYQASYAYYSHNYTMKNAGEQVKPGPLASAVTDMMSWVYSGIKNVLGLYNMDELIFNQGIRGSMAYQYGIMPSNWATNVTFYHWIFQGIAWALIAFAIVKTLVQRNLATINSAMRVSMIQQIQSLLITGFMLACTYPIISALMRINYHLVSIFYGASDRTFAQSFAEAGAYSNVLGAIIVQFVYLFISIYMNYVYIIRAIIVSLLIASAPLFIVSLAFGGNFQQLFTNWIKELCANIFLQSCHAFALSFFTGIAMSTRGIETIVVLGALIPLTEFFRQLIFGSSGETSGKLGGLGLKRTLGAISSVGSGLANVAKDRSRNSQVAGAGNQGGAESFNNTKDSSQLSKNANASATGSSNDKSNSKLSANDAGSMLNRINSTQDSMNSKASSISDLMKEKKDGKQGGINADISGNKANLESQAKFNDRLGKAGSLIGAGLKGKAKIAGGVGLVGAGIAASMVTGDANAGKGMIKAGAGLTANTLGNGVTKGKELMGAGISSIKSKPNSNTQTPDIVSPATDKSRFYQSQAYSELTPEGDSLVHRNMDSMRQEGIDSVSSDGKTASFTYTPHLDVDDKGNLQFDKHGNLQFDKNTSGSFHKQDLQNMSDYVKAFDNPKSQEAQQLRKMGIENAGIVTDENGKHRIKVTYNQTGMESLGFKSIATVGKDRVVERKSAHQKEETLKTIDMPVVGATVKPDKPKATKKQ